MQSPATKLLLKFQNRIQSSNAIAVNTQTVGRHNLSLFLEHFFHFASSPLGYHCCCLFMNGDTSHKKEGERHQSKWKLKFQTQFSLNLDNKIKLLTISCSGRKHKSSASRLLLSALTFLRVCFYFTTFCHFFFSAPCDVRSLRASGASGRADSTEHAGDIRTTESREDFLRVQHSGKFHT